MVDNKHIQLLHDGNNHWLLTFYLNGCVQVYKPFSLVLQGKVSIKFSSIYNTGKITIFLKVQKLSDLYKTLTPLPKASK